MADNTCAYCGFAIEPDDPHTYCDEQLITRAPEQIEAETRLAWDEYYAQREEEAAISYAAEICPCGHNHDQHDLGDGYCQAAHCDCPQFGEPPENYEIYTETNLGDGPGGFKIYE